MLTLDLGQSRVGRLWLNEVPEFHCQNTNYFLKDFALINTKKIYNNCVAFEYCNLPGHSSYYALLGVKFDPDNDNLIKIRIHAVSNSQSTYSKTLSLWKNEVFWGIPEEYANAIAEATKSTITNLGGFPSGTLDFSVGAHDLVGSSNAIFSKVTKLLINIMVQKTEALSIEQLKNKITEIV